jgi:hypothetical protein
MRKLTGVLAVLALTFLAILSAEARQPRRTSCTKPIHCPAVRDCTFTGCVNGTCEYDCW